MEKTRFSCYASTDGAGSCCCQGALQRREWANVQVTDLNLLPTARLPRLALQLPWSLTSQGTSLPNLCWDPYRAAPRHFPTSAPCISHRRHVWLLDSTDLAAFPLFGSGVIRTIATGCCNLLLYNSQCHLTPGKWFQLPSSRLFEMYVNSVQFLCRDFCNRQKLM